MRKSSREKKEEWRSFFDQPDTTVSKAREKLTQYQSFCRQQSPHQELTPGYDMLAWIGTPMSDSMHKIRNNEVDQLMQLIPKLDYSNLKTLYHRLKTNWTSPTFKRLCVAILRRIAIHPDFTKFSQKIMEHHATLSGSAQVGIPMKFLHQLWANDHHLSGTLCGTVFEKMFRPLINSYLNNSVSKGIPHTNLVDLVSGIGHKHSFMTPNQTREKMKKHLKDRIIFCLAGNENENGDVDMHKILVKKFLHLIRKMYCETNNPGLGALRCDIIIGLN